MTDYIKQDRETAEYLMMASQETIAAALTAARREGAERQRVADGEGWDIVLGPYLREQFGKRPLITDQEPTQ